ncbi:MAG: hypothetical protein MUE69_04525 [Myxococcota bacterium]|jgi:hypothetical protein|nr:hypothetical protein [Myxococcota bacterium]
MTTLRFAVVRIPHETLAERHPVEPTADGWGRFEGADGVAREVRAAGDALVVRVEGAATGLSFAFGDLWALHVESRGIAVHDAVPEGEGYDALVEGATWEGGLFSSVAAALGGGKTEHPSARPDGDDDADAEDGEEKAEGDDAFDEVADKLLSAVAKRSSRKALGAILAADHGQKDLGDVLDAFESETKEGDEALIDEVEQRFGHDPEMEAMASLLRGGIDGGAGEDGDSEEPEGEDAASGERAVDEDAKG